MEKKIYLTACASCLINAGEVGLFSRWISSLPLLDIMIPRQQDMVLNFYPNVGS